MNYLERRLRECYPNLVALEEIALRRGIPIAEPFQGSMIGFFRVLAPPRARYLDLIVQSERTPEGLAEALARAAPMNIFQRAAIGVVNLVQSAWGQEIFSDQETSAENEMSVVQYAYLNNQRILLTGDVGRAGLTEAANYAPMVGLLLPGINRFQVPHHGSRRNVSTAVLDRWLGPRLQFKQLPGQGTFTAIISSAKADEDHPRKAVVRAMIHRGANVLTTEGKTIRVQENAPIRVGWVAVDTVPYPDDQEED